MYLESICHEVQRLIKQIASTSIVLTIMTFGTYNRGHLLSICFSWLFFITSCWLGGFFFRLCFHMLVTGAGVVACVCDSQCKPHHPLPFPSTISKHITPSGDKKRYKGGVLYIFHKCWPSERPYFWFFSQKCTFCQKVSSSIKFWTQRKKCFCLSNRSFLYNNLLQKCERYHNFRIHTTAQILIASVWFGLAWNWDKC